MFAEDEEAQEVDQEAPQDADGQDRGRSRRRIEHPGRRRRVGQISPDNYDEGTWLCCIDSDTGVSV